MPEQSSLRLSDIPFPPPLDLKVRGCTGRLGFVSKVERVEGYLPSDPDGHVTHITWVSGGHSVQRHYLMDAVEVVDLAPPA